MVSYANQKSSAPRGISIIILTLDAAPLLDRLMTSFFDVNTYMPVELIIIDHGSGDDTGHVIARHAHKGFIRHINRGQNYSFANSCNHGAASARYPYLLFLNNDIIYTSDALPSALSKLEQESTIGAVGIRLDEKSKIDSEDQSFAIDKLIFSDSLKYFVKDQFLIDVCSHREIAEKNVAPETPNGFLCCKEFFLSIFDTDNIMQQADAYSHNQQWSVSAICWKMLLKMNGKKLSSKSLRKISDALFKLDDFSEAWGCLQLALSKFPGDASVRSLEKNQYYYHAYSSWLMETMAGETEWYKADGLPERPDWNTAVALCKGFVKPGVENPPGELRQFVQASLLLAEECRDKNDHQRADEVLREAMRHLGAGWVEDHILPVVQAIRRVRTEGGEALDAETEKIQRLLAGIPFDVLSVQGWLCLNDILNWNGLLRCGMVARDHALELARKQGDAHPKQADRQLVAARAALDQGDLAAAKDYISRYRASNGNARTADEITAYCCLLQGDVEGFRRHFGYPLTEADRRFHKYIRGKSVAIVGPAPSDEAHGKEIDSFDVVIRFNFRGLGAQPDPDKYGTKTNVSLYNAHGFRHLVATGAFNLLEELDFCLIRRPRYDLDTLPVDKTRIRQIHEPNQAFYKSMNAVPAMVYDLLLQGAKKIKIFNSNFYLSKQHHSEQYRYRDEDKLAAKQLRKLQPVMANHDLLAQIIFIIFLNKSKVIDFNLFDQNNKYLLCNYYMSKIEENINLHRKKSPHYNELQESLQILIKEAEMLQQKIENQTPLPDSKDITSNHFLVQSMIQQLKLIMRQIDVIQEELN